MTAPEHRCGECQLCCRLFPIKPMQKPSNQRCKHQRYRKGCAVYSTRPRDCRIWSCIWLTQPFDGLRRPDKCHYIVDPSLDFAQISDEGREPERIPIIQIWCDPRFPNAHEDKALRTWLSQMATQGYLGLIRYSSTDAFLLIPPEMNNIGVWLKGFGQAEGEHSTAEIVEAFGGVPLLTN